MKIAPAVDILNKVQMVLIRVVYTVVYKGVDFFRHI